MSKIFSPLFQAATYTRWLHLLLGVVFAGVMVMIYPGTVGVSTARMLTAGSVVDSVLLGAVALVPAMRHVEGLQARILLMPQREEDIGVAYSRSWADRRRTALWLIARVALGTATGVLTVRTLLLLGGGRGFGFRPPGGPLWRVVLALPVLFALLWAVVLLGRLQLALAVALLGPSPAERLAEAELRAEQLLERNRLARELHDSIGHALTVTILQAGAAREVADPAFLDKALAVIEETGRRAMEDLERTLVVLREAPEPGASAAERPGLDQAPGLFDTARAAGSPVEAAIEVQARQLPGVLSREAYRIVQEGVTNALKHAPGAPITVRAELADGMLALHCANSLAAGGRRGGGKGLRGVRERAALLGGEAVAGLEGSEWVLRVRLPLRLGL
ncbi:sensor histidine kinase [Kitasatospora sp. HPMI-4]|uniref:sensor histidine kinase n=1 Tax=Kitasatospora sp. HPMI-4 TaxID=3448443 RepID=UPI003F19312D